VIDVMLPDGNGVHLAVQLRKRFAKLPVVVMSGMALHTEEAAICDSYGFETLYKPFLSQDLKSVLHALLLHGASERAKSAGTPQ
jgi:DNA-binding response OmpR family regulator